MPKRNAQKSSATAPPPPAVIYARYSPRPGDTSLVSSIDRQFAMCREWAAKRGSEVVGEYSDEACSGGSVKGRDGLLQAMQAAALARGTLVAYDLSRVARNPLDALRIKDYLERNKASIALLKESIESGSAMGDLYFTVLASIAAMMREQNAETLRDTVNHLRKNHLRSCGGSVDYGLKSVPTGEINPITKREIRLLEIEPEEFEVVRYIYELYRAGFRPYQIERRLNSVPEIKKLARGKKHYAKTIKKILENRVLRENWGSQLGLLPEEPQERIDRTWTSKRTRKVVESAEAALGL